MKKTSNSNSKSIAVKRTEELSKEFKVEKITWLDLYNFLYEKAHDFKNLGSFDWNSEIKILDPKSGVAKNIETNSELMSAGLIGYHD